MKKLLIILALIVAPVAYQGCSTAPSERVAAVQTLKVVGHTAESAVATAGQLYNSGTITEAQLSQVTQFYDAKYLPAFRLAVLAVQSDVNAVAPSDVVALANQLATLVLTLQKH